MPPALKLVPFGSDPFFKELPRPEINLGKRNTKGKYDDTAAIADFAFVPETF